MAGSQGQRLSSEQEPREGPSNNESLPVNKFDLGPRWSSEEIHLFFESKIDRK